MNWLRIFLWHVLFLGVLAAPTSPKYPDDDDFYTYSDDYESAKVGDILKIRKTPLQLRSIYLPMDVKNSWQLLVRSTDVHGNASAIVTTVIEPYNADPTKLLSYQIAQDSAQLNCAPSYSMLYGASLANVAAQAEMFLIQIALNQGWYVVTPDYEGFNSSFTCGKQSGQATLDSIRATLKSANTTGISSEPDIALFGYSGGSLASGWAAALQPTYAEELGQYLKGAALGGFVTNITETVLAVEGTVFAGLTASGIAGLSNVYPYLKKLISEQLVEAKKKSYQAAFEKCLPGSVLHFAFKKFFSGENRYVKDGWDIFEDEKVIEILDENTLALDEDNPDTPQIPLFVFHGTEDTIVPFVNSQRAYDNWCDWGIESFEFAVDQTAGHITEILQGVPAAFGWLEKIMAGGEPVKGCTRTERHTNLEYPGSSASAFRLVAGAFKTVFGLDVGKTNETDIIDFLSDVIEVISDDDESNLTVVYSRTTTRASTKLTSTKTSTEVSATETSTKSTAKVTSTKTTSEATSTKATSTKTTTKASSTKTDSSASLTATLEKLLDTLFSFIFND